MEIQKVWFINEKIFIKTSEGIEKSMPLKWFPRLEQATPEKRETTLNYLHLEYTGKA